MMTALDPSLEAAPHVHLDQEAVAERILCLLQQKDEAFNAQAQAMQLLAEDLSSCKKELSDALEAKATLLEQYEWLMRDLHAQEHDKKILVSRCDESQREIGALRQEVLELRATCDTHVIALDAIRGVSEVAYKENAIKLMVD